MRSRLQISTSGGWLTIEGFTRNDPPFANFIGIWRSFSEPWDMAENGFKLIKGMGGEVLDVIRKTQDSRHKI